MNNKMVIALEWGPEAEKPMTWHEAMEWAESLGNGWRLPTIVELRMAYEFDVGGFSPDYYWSSSEDSADDAWGQYFNFGYQEYYDKRNKKRVRAVREVKR